MEDSTVKPSLQKHEKDLKSLESRLDQLQMMMERGLEQTKEQFELVTGTNQRLQSSQEELSKKIGEALESLMNRSNQGEVSANTIDLIKTTSIDDDIARAANFQLSNSAAGLNPSLISQSTIPISIPATLIQFGTTSIPLNTTQTFSSFPNNFSNTTRPLVQIPNNNPVPTTPFHHIITHPPTEPFTRPYTNNTPNLRYPLSGTLWNPYVEPPPHIRTNQSMSGLHSPVNLYSAHHNFSNPYMQYGPNSTTSNPQPWGKNGLSKI